jgi:lysylphosphatidylglycerol synthetase-like protein (DUF2156 family)
VSKIDLDRVWDDARAMGAANRDLLAAIAGMFVLAPTVLAGLLVKAPEELPKDIPVEDVSRHMVQFYVDNFPLFIGLALLISFGLLAMLVLLLRPERLTVGESLKAALLILPGYFVASLLQGMAVGLGVLLFIVPGLYMMARLSLIAPVAAAERCGNPITQLQRSFALTSGNGTGAIVNYVATTLVELVAILLMPKDIAELCVSIVSGLVQAGITIFTALIPAAIYRAAMNVRPGGWQPGDLP